MQDEFEFSRGRGGERAVEHAAVGEEQCIGAVDRGVHQGRVPAMVTGSEAQAFDDA